MRTVFLEPWWQIYVPLLGLHPPASQKRSITSLLYHFLPPREKLGPTQRCDSWRCEWTAVKHLKAETTCAAVCWEPLVHAKYFFISWALNLVFLFFYGCFFNPESPTRVGWKVLGAYTEWQSFIPSHWKKYWSMKLRQSSPWNMRGLPCQTPSPTLWLYCTFFRFLDHENLSLAARFNLANYLRESLF